MKKIFKITLLVGLMSIFLVGTALAGTYYLMVPGYFYKEADLILADTEYRIFNTSMTTNVTLRSIYVTENGGLTEPHITYNGLNGEIVPPLGMKGFYLKEAGAPGTGTRMVVFSYSAPEEIVKIVAVKIWFDVSGNTVATNYVPVLGSFTLP